MTANTHNKVMKTSDNTIMCTERIGHYTPSDGEVRGYGYVTFIQEEGFGEDGITRYPAKSLKIYVSSPESLKEITAELERFGKALEGKQ